MQTSYSTLYCYSLKRLLCINLNYVYATLSRTELLCVLGVAVVYNLLILFTNAMLYVYKRVQIV